MRFSKRIVFPLSVGLCILAVVVSGSAQGQDQALQRGYRTGYSDGYMSGYRDSIDSAARDYTRHEEYSQANRAYYTHYGSPESYSDGYRQGFEVGYDAGYERRTFEGSLPADLRPRGAVSANTTQIKSEPSAESTAQTQPAAETKTDQPPAAEVKTDEPKIDDASAPAPTAPAVNPSADAVILIPRETELILELQGDVNTEHSREGDKFTAKVAGPSELAGATIEGRISKVQKPGPFNRKSELSMTFDRIVVSDTRWSNMSATLIEVMPVKGDNVGRVDNEGTAIGQSSMKQDAVKVGAATGIGAVTGGLLGGGVGAAVGAGVGAGVGFGAAVVGHGKHVRLNRNQQIRVRTAYETQIR